MAAVRMSSQMGAQWTQTGGVRFGRNRWLAINISWPFATIECCREVIVVSYFGTTKQLSRTEIVHIEPINGMFSKGVRFVHRSEKLPRWICFWSRDRTALVKELKEQGYLVAEA